MTPTIAVMTASSGLNPLRCNSSIPNAPTAVSRPAGKSGIPKSRFKASAAPMNSARSVAIAMTSAWTHSKNVTGRGKRARQTSGRFLPVAIPSLADIRWMRLAMRLETRITHNSRYPNCAPPEMFVAKFPGSTYATAAINAGPRKGRSLRIPLLSPFSDSCAARAVALSPGNTPSTPLITSSARPLIKYRGATLTERGRKETLRLVRRHRLIETFLLEHLGYDWQEVHDEAERLEHAVSDGFTGRLAELLGHPDHDPHGDPIPSAEGTLEVDDSFTLSQAVAGQRLRISKVRDEDAAMVDYLGERNLVPGRCLSVREVRALDGVVIVEDEEAEVYALGEPLAHSIFVRNDS